jgi:pilus assembly protein CpaF
MRATRVLVSEVKDGAAFYMLQAMMIGHDGSMGTFHARNAKEAATKRLVALLSMSSEMVGIPYEDQLRFISAALHLVVHLRKMEDGTRKVVEIAEVTEGKDTPLVVNPIYNLEQGRLVATGHVPEAILEGSRMYGVEMPTSLFRKGVIFA